MSEPWVGRLHGTVSHCAHGISYKDLCGFCWEPEKMKDPVTSNPKHCRHGRIFVECLECQPYNDPELEKMLAGQLQHNIPVVHIECARELWAEIMRLTAALKATEPALLRAAEEIERLRLKAKEAVMLLSAVEFDGQAYAAITGAMRVLDPPVTAHETTPWEMQARERTLQRQEKFRNTAGKLLSRALGVLRQYEEHAELTKDIRAFREQMDERVVRADKTSAIPDGWCPVCGASDGGHKLGCQDGSEVL